MSLSAEQDAPSARRPQSRKKRRAILQAATETFLESGYGATTMDEIAARAQVSKQTIYHHFGSKDLLFAAIIDERCEQFLAPIAAIEPASSDLRQILTDLGRDFLHRVLARDSLDLHRLVVAEAGRFPELGRLSYESGPRRIVSGLARYLRAHAREHGLNIPDPEASAEQFYGALLGFLQLRAILCGEASACEDRIDGHVEQAVTAFMDGHRARDTLPPG